MNLFPQSFDFAGFAFDTLLWTAALIALVLVLRRPVTRWFGAPTAYALWALPMLRLVLPPVQLPAWLAPANPSQQPSPLSDTQLQLVPAGPAPANPAGAHSPAMDMMLEPGLEGSGPVESGSTLLSGLASLPWTQIALTVWLIGAAVFLYLRFSAYFSLRRDLVEGAREVGTTPGPFGTIRLIETPGTNGPLAFGVIEPVIALPPGFMAQPDRAARDLALAHELAHHRGHDLLINIIAQPLFALHWFNPLARYGWLALRRDQEAACDARVIAAKPREERALYAEVIASFAAGPNVALAAPMACPVLGDKSIVQRLRNLKMSEQSSNTKSRKLASHLMIGAAIVALPLTASITYAENVAPAGEISPPAPPAPPAPPTPPMMASLGVAAAPEAPEPPVPPAPPVPPQASSGTEVTIISIDPDDGSAKGAKDKSGKIKIKTKSKTKDRYTYVISDDDADGKKTTRYKSVRVFKDGQKMTKQEREEMIVELREGLAEADEAIAEIPETIAEALAEIDIDGVEGRTIIEMSCKAGSDDVSTTTENADGSRTVTICQSRVMAHALKGLKEARNAIAMNNEIQGEMRSDILSELDQQISKWQKETR